MTLIALAAFALMVSAVVQAENRLRAAGSILGWTVLFSASTELVVLGSAVAFRAGHPGSVAGQTAGPVFAVVLLCCSVAQWRDGRRARRGARRQAAGSGARELQMPGQAVPASGRFLGR